MLGHYREESEDGWRGGAGNETNFLYYPASIERVMAIEAESHPRPRSMSAGLPYDIDDVNDISPWAPQPFIVKIVYVVALRVSGDNVS